ncbi:MAG: hypothetical protein NWE88_01040, partial [Candidatus Bathyarchaeota archaeon]|nr:hypothetical protein [Candidatus Bathyarchaeota archaeon]
MKMRAVFANDKVDREGDRFTPEVLRKMAESPVPVPLLLNFNPEAIIGEICCFEYNEERQEVSGTI